LREDREREGGQREREDRERGGGTEREGGRREREDRQRERDLQAAGNAGEDGVEVVDREREDDLGGEVLQLVPPRVPVRGGQVPSQYNPDQNNIYASILRYKKVPASSIKSQTLCDSAQELYKN
jgi:hypothetical protein